jgi:hypothetical protein
MMNLANIKIHSDAPLDFTYNPSKLSDVNVADSLKISPWFADNSVVCDSRNNCILRDALYCSGEACNQQNGASKAAPVAPVAAPAAPGSFPMGFPGAMGIPTGAMPMGVPTGAMPMGVPTGAMPMGIPTGAMPMGNMGYKTMGYADNSTVCDSRGNCMVVDQLAMPSCPPRDQSTDYKCTLKYNGGQEEYVKQGDYVWRVSKKNGEDFSTMHMNGTVTKFYPQSKGDEIKLTPNQNDATTASEA